jgi:hypothetical protein
MLTLSYGRDILMNMLRVALRKEEKLFCRGKKLCIKRQVALVYIAGSYSTRGVLREPGYICRFFVAS